MATAERGTLFVEVGTEVYAGMVVGEHSRPGDLEVNPCKEKKLSNVRSTGAEEKVNLPPPRRLTLEDYITYMGPGEMLEVTPHGIRLRKQELDPGVRARLARDKKNRIKK